MRACSHIRRLCIAAIVVIVSVDPAVAAPEPERLEFGAKRPALYYSSQRNEGRRPLIVMLHGMCALPEYECPVFRAGATADNWLLCAPGPAACSGGGGAMWVGSTKTLVRAVDQPLYALGERHAARVDAKRKALVGYSLGAPAALRIALAQPGQWSGLMIVNAGVEPSAATLRKAGVRRIALVAGERDRSAHKLRRAATRLKRAGVDAQYFSMGAVGHYFDATSESRLVEALKWLGQGL
jgi:pimeloyl-ACP methyl ester carboxylesterase